MQLNEMIVNVQGSLPKKVENSIYYPKLKVMMHSEIINFCKERIDLKEDLNIFRMNIGQQLTEAEIREYLDGLKAKYNGTENIGLDYHIEITKYDYGVPVFVVLKRDQIYMKKFVFRFKKASVNTNLDGLSQVGVAMGGE